MQTLPMFLAAAPIVALLVGSAAAPPPQVAHTPVIAPGTLFKTADACIACHNGLVTPSGHDVSIGFEWRSSMMANAARDPYWQAGVRREVRDHPEAASAIEHECSACHMPMTRFEAKAGGGKGQVFANLPIGHQATSQALLAADGVSCTVCHQITAEKLGTRESFTAGFVVDTKIGAGGRTVFGPFAMDNGRVRIMRSASTFTPTEAAHIQTSETCATCHTLYTHALGAGGKAIGELPEQVPYLEWRHSAYPKEKSCQVCHMPVVEEATAITSVLGQPRPHFSRHEFRGGNFFMPRMLNRYRTELGVTALPQELDATARRAVENLQTEAASVALEGVDVRGGRLVADVVVTNLAGHKLPTAYPSRRAWLHLTVRDRKDRVLFESGAFSPDGRVEGNDNDTDGARYEPHYAEIDSADKVQVYESVMADANAAVTTGLLSGVRYVKDNRVLPRGFDKATADKDVAVHGGAAADDDFVGGSDRVRYRVSLANAEGPFRVQAELCYQSIGYRWAQNLKLHDAPEPRRFVRYYDSMAAGSLAVLARASATTR
jgi:hypothetical protein